MRKKIFVPMLVILCTILFNITADAKSNFQLDKGIFNLHKQESMIRKYNLLTGQLEYKNNNQEEYTLNIPKLLPPHITYARNIKGVYVNSWTIRSKKRMNELMKVVAKSNLNAIVVDIKDITGKIDFFNNKRKKQNLKELITRCQKNGIYIIGRLAVFKDLHLSQKKEYALKYIKAKSNIIVNSTKWTSPYSKEVWAYNLDIVEEAIKLGIDEIQFDYIRFPTLGTNSNLTIKNADDYSKVDVIVDFLKYARERLQGKDILLSADVFGLTTTIDGDLGIGQDITRMVDYIDYISPMIYPSHYNSGIYGLENPSSNPYQLISESLADAKEKLKEDSYKIRPWLQDFSLQYIYNKEEVKAQIKAVKDQQLTGWLLWNPGSNYTTEALINKIKEG
ncbi:hypothetical protein JCM16358_16890 [Halanaerocella petrolearia]